jgi:hypothetical protein
VTRQELPVIAKALDLAREMTDRVRRFPRDLRFVLGDRILATTYDILDLLVEARYTHAKRGLLDRANILLERLRFQVRLCVDEKLLTVRQYEYVAGLIQEAGAMVGGWRKSVQE